MDNDFINDAIKNSIKNNISRRVDQEIEEKVNKFRRELEDRKDQYIAEIMNGIRIVNEENHKDLTVNYRIIFENVYRIEENK